MSMGPDGLTHSAEGAGSWHGKAILNYHKKKKKKVTAIRRCSPNLKASKYHSYLQEV